MSVRKSRVLTWLTVAAVIYVVAIAILMPPPESVISSGLLQEGKDILRVTIEVTAHSQWLIFRKRDVRIIQQTKIEGGLEQLGKEMLARLEQRLAAVEPATHN